MKFCLRWRDLRQGSGLQRGMARGPQSLTRSRREESASIGVFDLRQTGVSVLLTRGMKGCYVFFEDADTKDFLLSRMQIEASDTTAGA